MAAGTPCLREQPPSSAGYLLRLLSGTPLRLYSNPATHPAAVALPDDPEADQHL